jgi:uncharacterized protein (TIGR03083 family)
VVSPGPELTDAEVEELLGAYALNACVPDQSAAIQAALARRPDLAREAARLARAAAWIGAADALDPPMTLRGNVMDLIGTRRAGARHDRALNLYRSQSERFALAVEQVRDASLDMITYNGLSAHDLVVHEAAQESLLAQAIDASPVPEIEETDIEARTAAFVAFFRGRPLDEVLAAWRAAVDANCAWADAADASTATANWGGLELPPDDAIVVRAYETWIHTDDLRRVVGLPGEAPEPASIGLMSDLASRILGPALELAGRTRAGKTARLVLTGGGGGEWLVAMDGSGPGHGSPDVTVRADTVAWCLFVGDRLARAALAFSVEGDASLADDLLAAAPALASL